MSDQSYSSERGLDDEYISLLGERGISSKRGWMILETRALCTKRQFHPRGLRGSDVFVLKHELYASSERGSNEVAHSL